MNAKIKRGKGGGSVFLPQQRPTVQKVQEMGSSQVRTGISFPVGYLHTIQKIFKTALSQFICDDRVVVESKKG